MSSALFFAPAAYPLGGVQTWLDYVIPGLAVYGIEATVALCAGKHHVVSAYRDAHPSLPVVIVENPTGSRQGRVNAIAALVEERKPTYAISANIADMYWGVAQARRNSRAVRTLSVMSLHAIQADFVDEIGSSSDVIDAVVATNRLTCKLVEASGYARERVFYAPYGVSICEKPVTHARSELVLGAEEPIRIAYVGRFDETQKRISMISRLCDRLEAIGIAFEFWLAGGGPDEQSLRESLSRHLAKQRIRWLGHVPAHEVNHRVYQHVDALFNPSFWETGPIVAWEAMAAGVIVVSSKYIGSGQESALTDRDNSCLFPIGDAFAAAEAVQDVCAPLMRSTIRANAERLVRDRFSVKASVEAWANVVNTIAELPLRPAFGANVPASGRLDGLFGTRLGERVRNAIGMKFVHTEPGSEWPHSYGTVLDSNEFWARCAVLDSNGGGSYEHGC